MKLMAEAATPTKAKSPKSVPSSFEISSFEMPTFDMQTLEVPAAFRDMAEKSISQSKDTYEKMKAVAEEATDMLENTYATTTKGMSDYGLKLIEVARVNTNAAFDFVSELFAVKSCAEALELSSVHAQKQFGTFTAQTKELSALAQKVATDLAEPMKEGATKAFNKSAERLMIGLGSR
jgi:phasin